jgi:hypothetical protein
MDGGYGVLETGRILPNLGYGRGYIPFSCGRHIIFTAYAVLFMQPNLVFIYMQSIVLLRPGFGILHSDFVHGPCLPRCSKFCMQVFVCHKVLA